MEARMEYFPFIHQKPKPVNEPIPLYKEIEVPRPLYQEKKEDENENEKDYDVIIIQL